MPTGQPVDSPAPVAEILRRVKATARCRRSASGSPARAPTSAQLPGGLSNTTHGEGVVRGVGYAVGIKNVGFSEGFDDYSTAKVRMEVIGGEPVATVHTAMAEVGQGGVTVHAQIARTELGVTQVTIHPADTQVGSAGSTSASRQTYVTGGAVKHTCELVREKVLEIGRRKFGSYHPAWATAELLLEGGKVVTDGGEVLADLVDVLEGEAVDIEARMAAPADRGLRPAHRPGQRPRPVLLRRAPRGRRGGHRTRPGQGHRTGRAPRTSARRSTRCPSSARSRAAPPRAWAWRSWRRSSSTPRPRRCATPPSRTT